MYSGANFEDVNEENIGMWHQQGVIPQGVISQAMGVHASTPMVGLSAPALTTPVMPTDYTYANPGQVPVRVAQQIDGYDVIDSQALRNPSGPYAHLGGGDFIGDHHHIEEDAYQAAEGQWQGSGEPASVYASPTHTREGILASTQEAASFQQYSPPARAYNFPATPIITDTDIQPRPPVARPMSATDISPRKAEHAYLPVRQAQSRGEDMDHYLVQYTGNRASADDVRSSQEEFKGPRRPASASVTERARLNFLDPGKQCLTYHSQ